MLEIFILGYCLYFFMNIYTAFMQIGHIKDAQNKKAVILEPSKYIEAASYAIKTQKVAILSAFYDFIIFFVWIFAGLSILDNATSAFTGWQKAVVFIDSFIIINWILALPFTLHTTFVLDKEFGFSNMTPSLFIKDTIKNGALFLIFGSLVVAGVALIIENFTNWWIYGFVFVFVVILAINMVYPLVRDKMYDKFEKLKDTELESKIEKLLDQVGFKSSGVFSVDASKRDNRLNAYFGGLGSTKRVVLFDTLVAKLTHNELLAVLGHELGHFKNGDIIKNIGIMGAVMFMFFAIFGNMPDELFLSMQLNNEPSSIIVLFLLFSPILSFFLMPLISLISRHNEYAADEFGSDLQSKEDLVNALLKLANENKSFPLSHPLFVFFYYSHPPLVQRLKELGYDIENSN
jgi:STE24 endopeptidase